ncbi:coth-domain-containing protein [Anaeromyces robustus]|uniref:Coth-domain-containing protein n=1 Tax=Anaeromyces robustus TaxID=1754192 RepID=A0A1Y1WA56_9FUNG|nr:coth-domain-containing protein [Anaeromyces robustus]|eukprot:ORX70411.1 coth-domain-containing protein [Anaeromyces robustus]
MNKIFIIFLLVLIYTINAKASVEFKVICTPHEYGGENGMSVNIDGKSYPMKSKDDDILYEYTYDGGEPTKYYYEIAGTEQNELSLIDNEPRTWEKGKTSTLYEIYGRKYTVGDSILKTIPRLYEPLAGYDKFSELFQEAEVPVIHIHMTPEIYNEYISLTSNTEPRYTVSFDYYTPEKLYQFTNVTFKLSGQGSTKYDKKPLKIDLSKGDTDKSNTEIFKREEFKLRCLRIDESYVRSKMSIDIAESLGLPVIQSSFARLYINNKSFGFYEVADLYKKKFVKRFFNVEKPDLGNLYKGSSGDGPAFLYPGEDHYEVIVTNNETDPKGDLHDLMNWLVELPDNATKEQIEEKLELDTALKYLLLEMLICHWDGYLGNGNNFWIYSEPKKGKFHFISGDFDSTLGKWCRATEYDIDEYITLGPEGKTYSKEPLLYTKLIKNPEIRPLFEELLKNVVGNLFNIEALGPRLKYFYEFLKQDMYWDAQCLDPNSSFHIPTHDFKGNDDRERATPEKIDEHFSDTATNPEDSVTAYIKLRSAALQTKYGIPELKANGKYGTVGGRIVKKNKKGDTTEGGDGMNLKSSDGFITKPSILMITIITILISLIL